MLVTITNADNSNIFNSKQLLSNHKSLAKNQINDYQLKNHLIRKTIKFKPEFFFN
jgi:hypothetical protein